MIVRTLDASELHSAFGIQMSSIEDVGTDWTSFGSGWGKVAPGVRSDPHQHDETETFVIVAGCGILAVDHHRIPVGVGTVAQFEPFQTHTIENTGDTDLLFVTFYWRDADRASTQAARREPGQLDGRPVFVFSTPPTPNGDLHLGHLSGPYLGADVFVRFQRLNGTRAWHLTGSDDYQSYVVACARREGRSPAETAAHYSAEIHETLRLMDIPLDQYTVTDADPTYREGLRDFFTKVLASGTVAVRESPATFDGTGRYLYEVDVSGACPTCGNRAGGNICEDCGEPNFCHDLVDPVANRTGEPPRAGTAARYELPLHELAADVTAHHHLGRVPPRLRELAARLFARDRLDVPVSHPSQWGVPPAEDGVLDQVIWVWPEMSYGFLHGVQELGRRLGHDWLAAEPAQDWKIVHFFGYDNSFYHAVLYPALYKLAFPGWEPDIDYHVNEFLLLDGAKFSTSRRHAIWGKEILNPRSVDAVRFYLSSIRSEGRRTNFDRADYQSTLHDTLIGRWQRWLYDLGARIERRHGGIAPDAGIWTPEHTAFLAQLGNRLAAVTNALSPDGFSLNLAARELDGIVADVERFVTLEQPTSELATWYDQTRTATALELAAARLLATCAAPVLPRFSARLAAALGLPEIAEWPRTVTLVPAGSTVSLTGEVFFHGTTASSEPADPTVEAWLAELVRSTLQLPAGQAVAERTLVQLGAASLQAIALQYQIQDRLGVDISIEELMGERTVGHLAGQLAGATG